MIGLCTNTADEATARRPSGHDIFTAGGDVAPPGEGLPVLTNSRAVLLSATGFALGATLLTAGPATASSRQVSTDSHPWVGTPTMSHVAGQLRADAQLGVNFSVDVASDVDVTTLPDITLTLDLSQVMDLVVITGLTEECDHTPKLITCQLSPSGAAAQFQSMTMTAAPDAATGSTGTIILNTLWPEDVDATNDSATIDLSVVAAAIAPSPPESTKDTSKAPTPAPTVSTPPVVIAPLPTVDTVASTRTPAPGAKPTAGVTLTPAMSRVPRAIGTRTGFLQTAPPPGDPRAYTGSAPGTATWGSPVFTIALGASSMGLLALVLFGLFTARRARPARAGSAGSRAAPPVARGGLPQRPRRPRPDRSLEDGPTQRLPRGGRPPSRGTRRP